MNDTHPAPKGTEPHPDLTPGTTTEYSRIHKQARKVMARACAECGTTKQLEVALRADAPKENLRVVGERQRRYSTDIAHYRTLCLPCHRAANGYAAGGPRCKWGHEYTPANTRIDMDGSRRCRECIHRQSLELQARRKLEALDGVMPKRPRRVVPPVEARILERLRLCAERRRLPLDERSLAALARAAYRTMPKPRTPRPKPKPSTPLTELTQRAMDLRAQAGADVLSIHDAVARASQELAAGVRSSR
ncbi:hypothetical protein [Streptacidiphilus sp. EB103A]|uniref:hypothetical protein n=1 Tax=Streptacidiphilus sp. EB103A TaxID=3156275 RepID=UPI003518DC75